MKGILTALIALLVTTAGLAAEPAYTPRAAGWDLKGLALGMSPADAAHLLEGAQCETFAPGVESCLARDVPFAGDSSVLLARFLDGALVYAVVKYLSFEQADAAASGLAVKFGPADRRFDSRKYVKEVNRVVSRPNYVWVEGDAHLIVTPFDEYGRSSERHYSAVTLVDKNLYDRAWLLRFNATKQSVPTDL